MPDAKLTKHQPHNNQHTPQRFHGAQPTRGLEDVPRSSVREGRFGRMFRSLPAFAPDEDDLIALGLMMAETKEEADKKKFDNPKISSGYTYLGQFIDHDITFDPNSKLQRDNDPNALRNFRTPRFDLDSLYADGPDNNPFMYDADGLHLLVGKNAAGEDDLPRNSAQARRALIGDPRNDENAIVSQLHLAFIKFHNVVVDSLPPETPDRLDQAQRLVRWHYQWIVVHDFLPSILGDDAVVKDIIKLDQYKVPAGRGSRNIAGALNVDLKFYDYKNQPFIPVEFSVAAYRFGHSMVRADYALNEATSDDENELPVFGPDPKKDLRGFGRRLPGREIEWARFFEFPRVAQRPQHSRLIDTKLSAGLGNLPFIKEGFKALAVRNLLRGKALGLPSGQAVARAMGLPKNLILTGKQLQLPQAALDQNNPPQQHNLKAAFSEHTPLWFYILKEAEVLCSGKKLGPVGGRIIAEVLIGLLDGDPSSYLRAHPTWQPTAGVAGCRKDGEFDIADLLKFAGVTISKPKKKTKKKS